MKHLSLLPLLVLMYTGTALAQCNGTLDFAVVGQTDPSGHGCADGTIVVQGNSTCSQGFWAISINGGAYTYAGQGSQSHTFNVPAGTYTLNVSNDCTCFESTVVVLSDPPCSMAIAGISSVDVANFGCADGQITVTGTTTNCPATYTIDLIRDGLPFNSYGPFASGVEFQIAGLDTGTYDVVVSHPADLCSASSQVHIGQPECLSGLGFSSYSVQNVSSYRCADGAVGARGFNTGCPGRFNVDLYLQGNGPIQSLTNIQSGLTYQFTGLGPGQYSMVLSDFNNNCQITSQLVVVTEPSCTASLMAGAIAFEEPVRPTCVTGSISGSATVNACPARYNVDVFQEWVGFLGQQTQLPSGFPFAYTGLDTGKYLIHIIDFLNECSIQLDPIVLNYFQATITVNGTMLTATAGDGYHWYLDGVLLPQFDQQTIEVTEDGHYTVEVLINNCFSGQSEPVTVLITSVVEVEKANVGLYPNPAHHTITLITATGNGVFQLHDACGSLIQQGAITATQTQLDVRHLARGLYFLSVNEVKGQVWLKLVLD